MDALGIDQFAYDCPHCHRALEISDAHWKGWLLCPECGIPGLPPARLRLARRARALVVATPEPAVASPQPHVSAAADSGGRFVADSRPAVATSATSLILRTGLVVSAVLLLFAYIESSTPNAIIFGALTGLFAAILLWRARR